MSNKGKTQSKESRIINREKHTKLTDKLLSKLEENYLDYLEANPKQLPSIVNFCVLSGINQTYIYELAISNPKVTEIINNIKQLQEDYLLSNGVISKSNPVFSIFLLKSKFQYRDSVEKLEQNNYLNISPDVLSDALKLMKENK